MEDKPRTKVPSAGWSAARRRWALTLLAIVGAASYIDRQILSMLIEPIRRDLAASDTAMGLLTGLSFSLFYVVAGVPLARMADRGVRRSLIAACVAAWSIATMICGLPQTYIQLALARIGVAVGEAGSAPATYSMLTDVYPLGQRGRVFAILSGAQSVGIASGMFLGGLLNDLVGWRMAFLIVGAPGLVISLLVWRTIPEPPRALAAIEHYPLRQVAARLWQIRSFRFGIAAHALISLTTYGLLAWAPAYLIRLHGMKPTDIGLFLGLTIALGFTVGSVGGGLLADRYGRRHASWYYRVPLIAMAMAVPAVIGFAFVADLAAAALLFGLSAIFLSVWVSPFYAVAMSLTPSRMRATASALLVLVQNLVGAGLGPLLVGAVSDVTAPVAGVDSLRFGLAVSAFGALAGCAFAAAGMRTLARDIASQTGADVPSVT